MQLMQVPRSSSYRGENLNLLELVIFLWGFTTVIDIEVSRLAIVCPCLFRIMILCYSPRPKSGWKLGYV